MVDSPPFLGLSGLKWVFPRFSGQKKPWKALKMPKKRPKKAQNRDSLWFWTGETTPPPFWTSPVICWGKLNETFPKVEKCPAALQVHRSIPHECCGDQLTINILELDFSACWSSLCFSPELKERWNENKLFICNISSFNLIRLGRFQTKTRLNCFIIFRI